MSGEGVVAAAVLVAAGFGGGWLVGLRAAEREVRALEARCAAALRRHCRARQPDAAPIRVLVIRERGSAEWLAERARRN